MPALPPRRLNLVDGMILVAGVAVGIALTRAWIDSPSFAFNPVLLGDVSPTTQRLYEFCTIYDSVAAIWLAVLTLVLLVLQLRPPRPRGWRAWRRPGGAATLAASLIIILDLGTWGAALAIERRIPSEVPAYVVDVWLIFLPGAAVAAVWAWAKLTRRWRPAPDPFDRGGRVLGSGWIVLWLLTAGLATWAGVGLERFNQAQTQTFEAQARAADAMQRAYTQQMQQYYKDQRAYLEELQQGRDPERVAEYLKNQIQALEQERTAFEAAEAARIQALASPSFGVPIAVPPPPSPPLTAPPPPSG